MPITCQIWAGFENECSWLRVYLLTRTYCCRWEVILHCQYQKMSSTNCPNWSFSFCKMPGGKSYCSFRSWKMWRDWVNNIIALINSPARSLNYTLRTRSMTMAYLSPKLGPGYWLKYQHQLWHYTTLFKLLFVSCYNCILTLSSLALDAKGESPARVGVWGWE